MLERVSRSERSLNLLFIFCEGAYTPVFFASLIEKVTKFVVIWVRGKAGRVLAGMVLTKAGTNLVTFSI